MPWCAKAVRISAIFAIALGATAGGCAKSAPQTPQMASTSPTPSAGAASTASAGPLAKSAAEGGSAATTPEARDSGISLPPTGGAPGAGPGTLLTDVSTQGQGACAGVSAADVIAALHTTHPEFAQIPSTRAPEIGGDGSFVFSYLRSDGSFAFVIKVGSMDCLAGCIDNEYWYFETDAKCAAQAVGHYHRGFDNAANCFTIEGDPKWGVPAPTDPAYVCGESHTADSISGLHSFRARGMRMPCTLPSADTMPFMVDQNLTIEIVQDTAQLARGKVTVRGVGDAWLDGRAFDAEFSRRSFKVSIAENNLPARCPSEHRLELSYDFEGFGPQHLQLDELDSAGCDPQSSSPTASDYCKGHVTLDLTAID